MTLLLGGSILLVGGAPIGAQSDRPGVFGEILDVRVVNVEVVVTDRQGNRIWGLEPGDFRLVVDGEPQSIDYFTEVRGGVAADRKEVDVTAVPGYDEGQEIGTSYLVFVDNFFGHARDRNQVLDALEKQVGGLGPVDRMAIVSFDGHRLEMLSTWETNPAALERALDRARRQESHGLQRLSEARRGTAADLEATSQVRFRAIGRGELGIDQEYYARLLQEQLERSVTASVATLRAFAAPPGRKVMVLLSGGWPFRPADYVAGAFARASFDERVEGGEKIFRPLTDTANLLGYTLYPVDVPGLQATRTDVTDVAPRDPSEGGPELRELETHFTLEYLAERTGGTALLNSRRLDAMEEVVFDTRSFYWIGFTPVRQGDDDHHEIRVEVTNPQLRVRYRDGFADFSRQSEVTMAMESGLLFGNAPSTEPLGLRVGEPERAGLGKVEVPIAIAIPLDRLTFVPVGNEHVARLELRVAVRDEKGNSAPVPVIPLELRRPEAPTAGEMGGYETSLKLRNASHEMVVSIFDPISGTLLSARTEIEP
jgi:VWFA-related protein